MPADLEVVDAVSVRLSDFTEAVPDLAIIGRDITATSLLPSQCRLLVEVSSATAKKDRDLKAPLCARAGIPELWVVDLDASETVICRQPSADGWPNVQVLAFSDPIAPLFAQNDQFTISGLL